MCADDLQELLNARPFEPLRLHINSGQWVDVRHPEMAIVGRSMVFVAVPQAGRPAEPGHVVESVAHYGLMHIVKIEPLNGNGPGEQDSQRK